MSDSDAGYQGPPSKGEMAVDAIKTSLSRFAIHRPTAVEPKHGNKSYDDIVSEAETGNDATTPSNAGRQAQSTDHQNQY